MNSRIIFLSTGSPQISTEINELALLLEKEVNISVSLIKDVIKPHIKNDGLSVAIDILNLTATTIGLFISTLSYWQSQKPRYTISISYDNKTISIDNIKNSQIKEVVSQIEAGFSDIDVSISEKDIDVS